MVTDSIFSYILSSPSCLFLQLLNFAWIRSNCYFSQIHTPLDFQHFLQGRFEILSLSGSFMPTESGGTKSRSGGMSVSLAGPDGRVVGGGLAGLLIAAGPVQVI